MSVIDGQVNEMQGVEMSAYQPSHSIRLTMRLKIILSINQLNTRLNSNAL